ncbi:glycoside hydrolase family 2 TIM barrel-domain containing protein [Tamlana sp. 2_MG-2023]|uniref:glycoside hydrolase family 2 TIM barrel-domain containing protein n=1 Tax=unclassified Tamlana TaxID=2614803 RepID=UPI0026E2E217|nr:MULTISPECIES: glycoside hydrolase family 2 TIM barrel-domain containing protein [unclassified Tamlana]MDO6761247.1 glycoside hydrolase family 2 TIM barrel-domain containing protein [Tamlana sp. 2_MG-2023]MDO6791730.1 glycoside hydrolase family 2 TIM barrel-domain containing protein [Tamlana sp. 1_MG-2023]
MRHLKVLKSVSILSLLAILFLSCEVKKGTTPIPDQNFNKDWLFKKDTLIDAEKSAYNDSGWRKLNLPHDWAIEGPFDSKNNARNGGLPIDGIAWYRKHFTIEKDHKNKQISIEFDGAMDNSRVYINGAFVGERHYGYSGFEYDLTPHIKFGEDNVIAVQLAPEILSERWYPGAGIYRDVRLKINDNVHIPQWGTYITTPNVSKEIATVNIETTIKNANQTTKPVVLNTSIVDQNGNEVASAIESVSIDASSSKNIIQKISVDQPMLWDIGIPNLYKAVSQVKIDDHVVDEFETEFGIRTIEFKKEGFYLNGNLVKLNGVCMHHDLGPLGAAVNYRATERQMQIMQDMGANALRTSHNPPSSEMLQVCDRLGIVVIDEAFDEWKLPKVPNGYSKYFDKWAETDLRDMIKRDRNHPSVIMWSIGNEILEQAKSDGWKIAKMLNDICHDQDNTRPTTAGFNYYPASFKNKLAYQIDVVGVNYKPAFYGEIREENPEMIFYGSETSSQTSTRGYYDLPLAYDIKRETNQVSSYDVAVGPPWAYSPDVEFDALEKNPDALGEFIWTGFDYLGEPTPFGGQDNSTNGYWNDDWPSHASYFAPVDLCGFPKDRFYLYQSQWTTEPMVHVLPHWNWEGKEGETIPVFSYTNCEEVELFVNGKSYGKKTKGVDLTDVLTEYRGFNDSGYGTGKGVFKSKYRLSWFVPYQAGSIKVVGYKNGKAVTSKEIKTAGKPAKIKLIADRTVIDSDGKDLSFITVRIEDKDGNLCPNADNLVNFNVTGAGINEAVGNGNSASLEPFQSDKIKAFYGKCLLIVKSKETSGIVTIQAKSKDLDSEPINLTVE